MLKNILVLLLLSLGSAMAAEIIAGTDIRTQGVTAMFNASNATSATAVLPVNKFRRFLRITNLHNSTPLYLSYSPYVSGTQSFAGNINGSMGASSSIAIAANASYEPAIAPVNALYLFTVSGVVSGSVTSGN